VASAPPLDPSGAAARDAFREGQLQTLAAMGLGDRELNAEMLAAHDGNVQAVLAQLGVI